MYSKRPRDPATNALLIRKRLFKTHEDNLAAYLRNERNKATVIKAYMTVCGFSEERARVTFGYLLEDAGGGHERESDPYSKGKAEGSHAPPKR